jgi:hypothetical protein
MAAETSNDVRDFHEQLKGILRGSRSCAVADRDRDAADDLVHDTVIKALTDVAASSRAPIWRRGFSASSATSSFPACAASGRPFRSTRRSRSRCRILPIRKAA